MREIKFRAWDDVDEKMLYIGEETDVSFSFDSSGITAIKLQDYNDYDDSNFCSLEHLKYMQYTGLKDKNDVEIYEGDVAQITYLNPLTGKPVFDVYRIETQDNGLVKMIHSSGEERWHRYLHLQYKEVEVVGNIYENPNLLKGESK